jgi:hypothetical protein
MDFGDLEPGYYALRSVVSLATGKDVTEQHVVLVEAGELTAQDGTVTTVPRVSIVDPESADIPEGVELPTGDGPVIPLDDQSNASAAREPSEDGS